VKTKLLIILALALMTVVSYSQETITLTSDNTAVLNGPVDFESGSDVIQQIEKLARKGRSKAPIYLYMHTPGGNVQAGIEMLEALKGSRRPVHTITSFAASMGFQIVQQLGTRYILDSGTLMSHHASGGIDGEIGGKEPSQIKSRLQYWEKIIERMDKHTVGRTNGKQTLDQYRNAYDHELWTSGSDAVDSGYADTVVVVSCDSSLDGWSKKTMTMNTFMGPVSLEYDTDNCPLNSSPKNVNVKSNSTSVMLSKDKLDDVINKFKEEFLNVRGHATPMRF
jgi:ATP-dependent protease ClpP protease subunit